jgi:hypothetical protein
MDITLGFLLTLHVGAERFTNLSLFINASSSAGKHFIFTGWHCKRAGEHWNFAGKHLSYADWQCNRAGRQLNLTACHF